MQRNMTWFFFFPEELLYFLRWLFIIFPPISQEIWYSIHDLNVLRIYVFNLNALYTLKKKKIIFQCGEVGSPLTSGWRWSSLTSRKGLKLRIMGNRNVNMIGESFILTSSEGEGLGSLVEIYWHGWVEVMIFYTWWFSGVEQPSKISLPC